MIERLIDIDKQLMVFLNKTISNPIFDIAMPIITNQNFLAVTGIILIAQESNLTLGQQPPPIRLSDLTIFAFTELPSLLTRIFALSFKS